jgi:hypothetical protein
VIFDLQTNVITFFIAGYKAGHKNEKVLGKNLK